jgi:alpha-tubulin suppressor-like RCC1 family protein
LSNSLVSRLFPQHKTFDPTILELPENIVVDKIEAGLGSLIIIDTHNNAWAIGDNKRGQLGFPSVNQNKILNFKKIPLPNVNDVKTGLNYSLLLSSKVN